ncbi:MAG: hypothetical protein IJM83_11005 [Firmicutes bacterium]|nr:hypothetical protein [Bacillota bacterium]
MFDYEDFYKLYNDRVEKKYQELKDFLRQFVMEGSRSGSAKGGEKGFRDRMMNFSRQQATFLFSLTQIEEKYTYTYLHTCPLAVLKEDQEKMFGDLFPASYSTSTLNPSYMISQGGKEIGLILTDFACAFKEGVRDAFCHRRFRLVKLIELYFEMHKLLSRGQVRVDQLQELITNYRQSESRMLSELKFHSQYDPSDRMFHSIVMEEDLYDTDYLYLFGLPVNQDTLKLQQQVSSLPKETISEAAAHLARRIKANQVTRYKDFPDKRILVSVSIPLGTEILGKAIVEELEKVFLTGFIGEIVPQGFAPKYRKDHRFDLIRGMDDEQIRVLEDQYRQICEENAGLLQGYLGQIRVEMQSESDRSSGKDEVYPRDLVLKGKYEELDRCREKIRLEVMEQKHIPCLSLIIPSKKENSDAYIAAFDELMDVQIRSELQTERSNQVVADTIGSGYALYISGVEGNETDLTIGLSGSTLLRNSGYLPCGEVVVQTENSGTNGILHIARTRLGGKEYHNLHLSFEDGILSQATCDEEANEEPKNISEQIKALSISSLCFGLNMSLLEKLSDLSAERQIPEEIFSKTCLKIEFGAEGSACFPYEKLRSICSIKTNGLRSDIIREGLFMPVGSDAMNMPLLRIRRKG